MAPTLLTDATANRTDTRSVNELAEWDLDVSFLEAGEDIDKLIYMTGDGCGTTCQSACNTCR